MSDDFIRVPPDHNSGKRIIAQHREKIEVSDIVASVFIGDTIRGVTSNTSGTVTGISDGLGTEKIYYLTNMNGNLQLNEVVEVNNLTLGTLTKVNVPLYTSQTAIGDADNPSNVTKVDVRGGLYTRFKDGNPELNAYNAVNVSGHYILGEYRFPYDTNPLLFDSQIVGIGSSVEYDAPASSCLLKVGTAATDSVMRRTFKYHTGTAPQSHKARVSVSISEPNKIGIIRRWGYYDDLDGVFLEVDDGVICFVLRNSSTGVVTEERITQTNWSADQLTTGKGSDFILDLSKACIAWFEFQWYGSGIIRCGFYGPDGSRVTCHEFKNGNQNSRPYMSTPTLPLTWEIFNTAVTDTPSQLRQIAASVETDGGKPYNKHRFGWDTTANPIAVSNTEDVVFALQMKEFFKGKPNRVGLEPSELDVYVKGTGPVVITIYVSFSPASYAGYSFTEGLPNSASLQFQGTGAETFTAGVGDFKHTTKICNNSDSTFINISSILEDFNNELRRSPFNDYSMYTAITAKTLFAGDTGELAITIGWKEYL
jgi:hypothetical protein